MAMHFTDPLNWLWLLPLAGAIVLLWRHRPRREEMIVPSLRLWLKIATDSDSDPSQRFLRRNLLLFLQLLTIFLLVLALARPFLYGEARAGQQYVLLVDNSASMQATDIRPSRLEAARAETALFVARKMRPEDTAVIMQTSPRALALCRPTGDPARLRAALARIASTDAPGDMAGALTLAQSLLGSNGSAHVLVYSDGLSAQGAENSPLAVHAERHQTTIGTPQPDNVGITALTIEPGTDGGHRLLVALHQGGPANHSDMDITLLVDGTLRDARQVEFTDGAARVAFDVPASRGTQVVTVRLEHLTDDLASDNQASAVIAPVHIIRVLLVSAGNVFLERGLAALPDVQVTKAAPAPYAALRTEWSAADVVALDGPFPLGTVPPGRYLSFSRAGLPTPFTFNPQPPANIDITRQDSASPIMHFVDMRGVQVHSVVSIQANGWAQALAGGARGPMVVAGQNNGSRIVSVAFNIADSDWPLRIAFPLFLSGSIRWLAEGTEPGSVLPDYAAGQLAQVTLPPGPGTARIAAPDGVLQMVSVPEAGGTVALPSASEVGIYSVSAQSGMHYAVPVNLLSPSASSLVPRSVPALNQPASGGTHPLMRRAHHDWWTLAALLALALLCAEWWVYHRRRSG